MKRLTFVARVALATLGGILIGLLILITVRPNWCRVFYVAHQKIFRQNPKAPAGFTGVWRSWGRPGVRFDAHYVKGVMNGQVIIWMPDGGKLVECTYLNGQKEGTSTEWLPSSRASSPFISTRSYHSGKEQGQAIIRYGSGQTRTLMELQNGQLHGRFAMWDRDGTLIYDRYYTNDVEVLDESRLTKNPVAHMKVTLDEKAFSDLHPLMRATNITTDYMLTKYDPPQETYVETTGWLRWTYLEGNRYRWIFLFDHSGNLCKASFVNKKWNSDGWINGERYGSEWFGLKYQTLDLSWGDKKLIE